MWLLLAGASSRAFAIEDGPPAPEPAAPAPEPASPAPEPAAPAPPAAPPRFRIVDAPAAPGGWQVLDSGDGTVDSGALAAALEDTEQLARLRREHRLAGAVDVALVGAGLGLAGGGVFLFVLAGPATEAGVRPDPLDYREWTDWRADTDDWEARMDIADRRDERIWGGVTLLTGAVLAGALVPMAGQDARARAEHPALLWDRATLLQRLAPAVSVSPAQVQLAWTLP